MEQPTNANLRISKRKLEEYTRTLTEREKTVLRSIQKCRFMQTDQVKRLHFRSAATPAASLRAATRTLAKLHRLRLIQPLRRRIGGARAGSASYVWVLKEAGAVLLNMLDHQSRKPTRPYEPTNIFLKHTLAVTETYIRLHTLRSVTLVKAELEPACWRSFTTLYGASACLRPDLYAVTAMEGYEDYWFFEVDLDTEAPSRIIRKCEYYGKYYLSGEEQKRTGIFPRVVWIVPDEKRRQTLQRHICQQLSDYKDLFTMITFKDFEALIRTGAASAVMGRPETE